MSNELPGGWASVSFGEYCRRFKRLNEAGADLEPLSVTKDDGIVLQSEKFNKRIATDTSKYKIVRRGEFAYDPMSLYYGAIGQLDCIDVGVVSPAYITFDTDEQVEKEWFRQLIQSELALRAFDANTEGGNLHGKRKKTNWKAFSSINLPTPPLAEQKKIAMILSSVDEAIEATRAVIEQTRRVKQGLLQDLLSEGIGHQRFKETEIGQLPASWGVKGLFELAELQHGKSFPSSDYQDQGIKLVRPGNLHTDNLVLWDEEHTTRLPPHYWDQSEEFQVGEHEILMNLTAQSLADNFLGRVCMTPSSNRCLLNQRIGRLKPKPGISRDYLFWVLQGPQFREHLRTRGQGSKVQHLYNRDLESALIPVPQDLEEQESISKILWDARASIEASLSTESRLTRLKAGLLQDLLTGKVRVKT